jgi:hypothetical protein
MPDVFIFFAGLAVTLMVGGAVAVLMWGAANEPAHGEPFERPSASDRKLRPLDRRPLHEPRSIESSPLAEPRREQAGA